MISPNFAEEVAQGRLARRLPSGFASWRKRHSIPSWQPWSKPLTPGLVRQQSTEHVLQKWIKNLGREHVYTAPADSWFINDRLGRQIARDPFLEEDGSIVTSFMGDYSFRDYFHGKGRDRPKGEAAEIRPIEGPNICAVYVSSNSGKYKVHFPCLFLRG